jgi:membrane fusion protein (multidrug efflux system)
MKKPQFLNKVPNEYLLGGVIVLVVLGAFLYYQISSFENTDDAFIDGHIAPVSAQVAGRIVDVSIKDNQIVKKGDVLARIDEKDYVYQRDEARADEMAASAELQEDLKDEERYKLLLTRQEISKQEFDHTSLKVRNAQAQEMMARAKLNLAELNLSRTSIVAPIDGKVSARTVEDGEYVQVGQALLSIVSSDVWVTANFKETQLKHMKVGNPVDIHVDAYPGVKFTGRIDSLQAGTGGAFSLLPAENASGNYIKVVQRVPVKITINSLDSDYPLWPGMSVSPKVDLRTTKG